MSICRLCGRLVDPDGEVVPDPFDGRPMHISCREDYLAGRMPACRTLSNSPTPAALKKFAMELALKPQAEPA